MPEVRPMYFEHLTMRDGLSQSTVMSILQDSQGFLWLATESGLDRYDGYSIREYRRERGNKNGLASDYVWKVAEDARGDLWLATIGGGIARWDRRNDHFQQFRHDPSDPHSLASDAIRTLHIDAKGQVWAATERHGLDVLDPQTGRARHFHHIQGNPRSLSADAVFALYTDRAGRLWVGTDRGLSRYEPSSDDFNNDVAEAGALDGVKVRAIIEDHTGALWIGTFDSGLYRLDPQTRKVTSFQYDAKNPRSLSNDRVRAIMEDDARRLWIATSDGLNLFNRSSESFVRYGRDSDNPHSLRDDDVMSLYQDRSGVLWVGTRAGGASHWSPQSWSLGHYRSSLFANVAVNSFADDGEDTVWVGTSDGLVEIDTRSRQEHRYTSKSQGPLRLADNSVMALLHDRSGALWIGTMTGGLARMDPQRRALRFFRTDANDPTTLPADGVMSLYEDRAGDVWIGTFGGGIARIDQATGQLTRYPHSTDGNSLSSPRASAIVEDRQGNLWIGTIGGGLNLLERSTGRFHAFRRNDRDPSSLSDDTIYALHADPSGNVWVGTAGGGLDRVVGSSDQPDAIQFQSEKRLANMPSQVVYGIESDHQGNLWLSTNNGLVRLDPREGASRLLREPHGLQADEFNFNAHYRGRDGTLYFGGNGGFNAFQPDVSSPSAPPPRLALTSVAILNQQLPFPQLPSVDRPLALKHDDKLVTFEFAALDFVSPANNRYMYRLEGFDPNWVEAGRMHRATYTNLDAGDYLFRVRATNADGIWNRDDLTIPVRVAAAPWHTLPARLSYVAVALLIFGYFWWQHRKKRQRERNYNRELEMMVSVRTHELEERNHQLQEMSRAKSDFVARMNHELRTPMNGVLGMSELLLDTHLDAVQRRFAEGIHRSADSLLAIVDDVLDFSKLEAGRLQLAPVECDLVELVEQTAEMLAARASGKNIELLCDSPARPVPRVRADVVRLRQVLVNLGGNAVKFTEQGEVTLRVAPPQIEGDRLRVRLEVSDTGIGIEPVNQSRIFEEFVQEDASTTRRYGGTGLGLAIARQLVELMGGELSLVSSPGVGSTFSVELSLQLASPTVQPRALSADLLGLRILVADDNAAVRRVITHALDQWGAHPVDVGSMAEVLRELRATAYNAVIIDHSLLDCAIADELQSVVGERAVRPRVIRLASFVNLAQSEGADQQCFDGEITKPVRLSHLLRTLTGDTAHDTSITVTPPAPPLMLAAGARVLVVEDQSLNRDVAEGMLKALGLEVDTAHDGSHALEMLARTRYDVVLMDCRMPVMDGYAATTELRRREGDGPRVPVIALTADTTNAAREACLVAGMDDYLGKPFSRATLRAALVRWIPAREPAPQPEVASVTQLPS
ncbi:hybrid sensor histidine kinase/response regulator [Steroidobacter agaridevorans]|uniref:hybrid sensor histidine kinase/response regulator n=1 Tax=Steroidobacter agaridevorans TaxID=2695856 RepID=UPI00137AA652|nr:hybrid sensor histidine kinase/response regulator [Steroidobacter agaridevorans]